MLLATGRRFVDAPQKIWAAGGASSCGLASDWRSAPPAVAHPPSGSPSIRRSLAIDEVRRGLAWHGFGVARGKEV